MCKCDLSATGLMNMTLIMISIIENRTWVATIAYPAALEPTLVDIAVVNVVVLLDDVQMSCSADHHASRRHQEVEEVVDRSSRCVKTLPKNLIADFHPSI